MDYYSLDMGTDMNDSLLQIDISCMGQNLLHTQTLKEVRDAVWVPRLLESVNSTILSLEDYSLDMSSKHLMSLHYERRSY